MPDAAQYVSEMDLSLPLAGASAGEGDDEIRAVKRAVQQTLVGSPANHTWPTVPDWDKAVADPYNTPLVLGPRALNSLPKTITGLADAIVALANSLATTQANLAASAQIPVGLIGEWSGLVANIPANWVLCDGSNGTPDMRGRFIVGSNADYPHNTAGGPPKATAGANVIGEKVSGAGTGHKHGGKTQPTVLDATMMPQHSHPYRQSNAVQATTQSGPSGGLVTSAVGPNVTKAADAGVPSDTNAIGGVTGGGLGHFHDLGADMADEAAHTHKVDTRPPWYALAYIMFKGVPPPAPPTVVTPIPDQAKIVGGVVGLSVASHFAGETSYSCGLLPAGVVFNSVTGQFTGTCTTAQVVATEVTAINSGGTVSDTFTWTIT